MKPKKVWGTPTFTVYRSAEECLAACTCQDKAALAAALLNSESQRQRAIEATHEEP